MSNTMEIFLTYIYLLHYFSLIIHCIIHSFFDKKNCVCYFYISFFLYNSDSLH